jgi:hypothetical protein
LLLHKPASILNNDGKLVGILGNELDKGSTPAIVKIDADEAGFCFTIQNFGSISKP